MVTPFTGPFDSTHPFCYATPYITSHFSGVFSTPNPGVFDEKVYTHVFTTLTHSVRPVTMADTLVSWVVTLSV